MRRIQSDIVVIGGGLIGCWAAFFLARSGRDVLVVEAQAIGAQSSGVNFGNLRIQGRFPGQLPLALRAQKSWDRLAKLIGVECELSVDGHAYLAITPDERELMEKRADASRPYGLQPEIIEAPEIRRRWPWLMHGISSACLSAPDSTANPRTLTPAVARAAQAHGARFLEFTRVDPAPCAEHPFVFRTSGDVELSANVVINTAGAWGSEISEVFGEKVPIFAAGPPQFVTEPLPYFMGPSFQLMDGTVSFRQTRRGNVIVAAYPRGMSDRTRMRAPVQPEKTVASMLRLGQVVPRLRAAHIMRVWSGIEGYLPDMLPIIGPSSTQSKLIHAFGFSGHGFQLGPGVGEVLCELVSTGGTTTDIAPFSIGRFAALSPSTPDAAVGQFDLNPGRK